MAKSNISNKQKKLPTINNNISKIFVHLIEPDNIPYKLKYVEVNTINDIPDNTLETVMVSDLFDYIEYSDVISILDTLFNKLKTNGQIIVQSPDLYALSSAVAFNDIDIDTAKIILYGSQKKNMYTIYDIENELTSRNFQITEKRFINIFEFYISAIKNNA